MVVYRVIGSPVRVATYSEKFKFLSMSSPFRTMLYDYAGPDSYDIPTYETTSHHSWSDIQNSPYVQFHPGVVHGDMLHSGVISDASAIWVGKYYSNVYDYKGDVVNWLDFYLRDFYGHAGVFPEVKALNSNGQNPALWSTGTYGNPGAYYKMEDNGNFVIYSKEGEKLWEVL